MKIINYNDKIRDFAVQKLDCYKKSGKDEFKEFYEFLYKDKKLNKNIISVIFLTSYIVNYYTKSRFPDDYDLDKNVKLYSNANNINELIEKLDLKTFEMACKDTIFFNDLDDYSKKKYVLKLLDNKDYVLKIMPCYIYDLFKYGYKHNKLEFLDLYKEKFAITNNKNKSLKYASSYATRLLLKLEETDFDDYKIIMTEILKDSYSYNKYLISKKNESQYSLIITDEFENNPDNLINFTINNLDFLNDIVKDFINYNLLDEKEKNSNTNNFENDYLDKISPSSLISINSQVRKCLDEIFNCDDKKRLDLAAKLTDSPIFDLVASVLYNDSMSLKSYDYLTILDDEDINSEYEYMKDLYDFEEYKLSLLDSSEVLLNEINNSISFHFFNIQEKRDVINLLLSKKAYDSFLTFNYVFDILEFNREFKISDASFIYYDILKEEKDEKVSISKATCTLLDELESFLYTNEENYNSLIYEILKAFYLYAIYLRSDGIENVDEVGDIINLMEKDLNEFLLNIKNNYNDLQTIVNYYYKFIALSQTQKEKVVSSFDKLDKKGKIKIFGKNKNSI